MTLAEISRESGLRQDLVTSFVPGVDTASGKLYSAHHVALARYVKELTDLNVPSAAVQVAVHDLESRSDSQIDLLMAQARRQHGITRARVWAGISAAAAAALLIGGIAGGLIGYSNGTGHSTTEASAPTTITAPAKPAQINPTIPVTPDPVCAEWSPITQDYLSKERDWAHGTDPHVAMAQRTPEQQALTRAVIPIMRDEVADMRRMAGKAQDPLLKALMQGQAMYEEAYADRLPNYQPSDDRLWVASVDFGNAVNSMCTAVAPR
ncbi:hypothetical protein [Mycobacterium kyorinense]|uniref:Uncharacterized protein n=2 Tax=Mycobacterium TaxID=1763 RepID=A0A1X1YMD5_9MYCO|nr:hypothetical protein [Mycobacterium kyorinense]ORW12224.1 hypothetical protein AWC14_01155 [Mycobacterium kyorinense]